MADDQAAQRRSRLAPPPTSGVSTTFRAPPPATTATTARFGFGSSTPRTAASSSAAAPRASTLSTSRTSTFSSSAFGRSTVATKKTTATPTLATQRPSSAETALSGSRLRQKPTTTAAAAAATSAPKHMTTTNTTDLFATLASDAPPRSASGGSLPFAMASTSTLSSSAFTTSYAPSALASKPAGQLFSMDDADLGGDDGWGVDSPSNILSPASATGETPTASGARKPFEDEDEFGWADDTPVPSTLSSALVQSTPVHVVTSVSAAPLPSPAEVTSEPTAASSSGWGNEFEYSADATEAAAVSGWKEEDEWGTIAPEVNGATARAIEVVAEAPATPLKPVAAPVQIQAPPLSAASADLGAILSPSSGPAGEFWGDESDDVLFSDEEQADATPMQTPLPDVAALSLESPVVSEEPKQVEALAEQPVTNEFSFQGYETTDMVTEAVPETNEWEDDGDWGDQLRLSEVVDADLPFAPPFHPDVVNDAHTHEADRTTSAAEDAAVSAVSSEQHIAAKNLQTNEVDISHETAHPAEQSTSPTGIFEAHTQYSHNESHSSTQQQRAEYYGHGADSSYSYERHAENLDVPDQQVENQDVHVHHSHHTADNDIHVDEQGQSASVEEAAEATVSSSDFHVESRSYEERSDETMQRQVSWETREDECDGLVEKPAVVEDSAGPSSFTPTNISTNKPEVTFGTSSFAAAELTYGHYHHDHHRTPSEAEVGSVASFAEASSAGATFGGSDHVSDGTYSDGDYASETRSVFGSSSAHSTAFITEPPSSSDGQASNEENGTYDHQSDMSSTIGGGGGASEFDVSSTRSALFENEVASIGFEQGDEAYDYGEHHHHSHFDGSSYENEYSHAIPESKLDFTEEAHSAFDRAEESAFSHSSLGRLPETQQSPSPVYSRSSTPATYGVSSSQDLPTASDLEFENTDSENLFASSSSEHDAAPFAVTYESEISSGASQSAFASPLVGTVISMVPPPLASDTSADDANPFASSGSGFPSPPAPPSFVAPPPEIPGGGAIKSTEEVLPSADSLFGASPAKASPFGHFASPPGVQSGSTPFESQDAEAPLSDAGSLFADVSAAHVFGDVQQPSSGLASNFFGGDQTTHQNYGHDSAQYGYDNSSHPSADEAFGAADQSQGFETGAYGYDSSYQSANEAFAGHTQSNDFQGSYMQDAHQHPSAADPFGAPGTDSSSTFGGQNGAGFHGYDSSSGDVANAESFFGGASTSAAGMFGLNEAPTQHEQHEFGFHYGDGDAGVQSFDSGHQNDPHWGSSQGVFKHSVVEDTAIAQDFGPPPTHDHGDFANNDVVPAETPEALSSDITKEFQSDSEHNQHDPAPADEWSYSASTHEHSFENQEASFGFAPAEGNAVSARQEEPSSFNHGYAAFGENGHEHTAFGGGNDTDSFFGRSASAPPHDLYSQPEPSADTQTSSFPSHSVDSPIRSVSAPPTNLGFGSAAFSLNEESQPRPNDMSNDLGEASAPRSVVEGVASSTQAFESGVEFDYSAPFADQSQHEGGEPHFGGNAANDESPFQDGADSSLQLDSSAFFGGQHTSGVFGEAAPFDQSPHPAHQSDSAEYFGGPDASGAFGAAPPYDQNVDPVHHSDPMAYFGDQHGSGAFGEAASFEQSTGQGLASESAAYFGGQDAAGAFGDVAGSDASGFFSDGPSKYHHSGGIYAQPPQASTSPAYPEYDTNYGHHQEGHGAFNSQASEFASTNANPDAHYSADLPVPLARRVDHGASASRNFQSPTAAGTSHFVSAQSASAFQYNSAEAAPQNGVPGGHHHPHPDASYRTPTLQPRAGPTTPTMNPSPLQSTQAQPNYKQFAAPTQAPDYGTSYELKPTHGYVASSASVLTSNKYKDPNMIVPSCLSSFGFGGNVVTMFPKQKLRLNSASFAARNSPRTPQSMQYDSAPQGELRKGPVGVYRMDHVHPRNREFDELDKFPGPLSDNVPEEAILQYVEEKMNSTSASTLVEEDERLLLGVLRVLIKCNGRLRSEANANPNEPTSPEVQLVSLLKESDQRRRRNYPSQFPSPKPVQYPTHSDAMLRNASRVRELLLLGDRKAAVDVAIQAQMWPEAMLIGSFTDKDEYKRVLCAYFTSHYAPGDPCRALYLSFADQQERSVHEPQKLMQQNKEESSSDILSSWVVHVQMLLANRTADTNKILIELGDRLWKEANAVVAAHVCYLLAGNTVEAPSPSSKIALLGADHRSPEEARFYVSPAAVQRTEIYEWVQKKINPAATNMIPFQGYKLIYAMILADHGKLETAFKYVNSMLTVIRAITATMKPGTSMYLEGMQNQLVVLDDRLRQHLGQDRADSVAAAASAKQGKWGLGSALSIMGKIVTRVVEGNDAPQQSTAPRSANGSLFPGAPRSTNNNLPNPPEYPSGAGIGYSSQPAPTMVPAAPGSGRSGGIYGAHVASYNHAPATQPVAAPPPAPTPSIPAAFNVPRQLSGRNSAPPHQPMPEYSAPTSGTGGNAYAMPNGSNTYAAPLSGGSNAYAAPLSGGHAYSAPPSQPLQHQPQQPSSFPPSSYDAPPPVQAPPPFQKPSLDLSGSAGKSGFGGAASHADAAQPKSPPRSPRTRGDGAPGSDKGSSSPKTKEAPKKGGRSKTPPPSRSSSGWLSGISTFIAAKMNPDAKVAKLGEHMDAYFDEEKKRWVFPGETQTEEPTMPSAPPTGPLPGSTPASSSGGPPGGPHGAHSAPGSMAGGAAPGDPLAALMAPPPARALMKKDPLAAMMAPPPNRAAFGPRSNTMQAKRPPPRPQFAVFKPAPGSQASSAPSDLGPPSSSGEPPAPPQ